jgi:hypothetical protein
MPIDFPNSPTTGQVYTYQGKSWVYNGTGWDAPRALSEIGAVQTFADAAARTAAIPSPTEGIVSYLVDTNALEVFTTSWNVINPSSGNVIINGAFDHWQRGTSFSFSGGTGGYACDRFATFSPGGTMTVSRQTFSPGSAPVAGYEGSFFARISNASTIPYLYHYVEDVRTLAGQTVTLSFFAKRGTASNITAIVYQSFGSGGSSTFKASETVFNATTSWARYSVSFAMPSLSGKTIGTSSSLLIEFVATGLSDMDLWGIQLEAGPVATPFRRNGSSIQAELAACQRYYLAVPDETIVLSSGVLYSGWLFPTTMRVAPTITIVGNTSTSVNIAGIRTHGFFIENNTNAISGIGFNASSEM